MSLLDFFRGQKKNPQKPPDIPVASSDSGDTLYSDDIVSEIYSELERRRSERVAYELQWTMNANFLNGHQNCEIDMKSHTVVTEAPTERKDKERRVYNRIAPLMETRDANLGSVKYDMVVDPRTSDPDDIAKASVSTKLLQYIQSSVDFTRKQTQLRRWTEVCGTGFAISWWDKEAGRVIGVEVTETLITDENGNSAVKRSERDIHEGDMAMGLLTAYEVFPHSLIVEEITDPCNWELAMYIPFSLFEKEFGADGIPAKGTTWRANFYTCADATSHPRWATWNPIKIFNFHQPECFGDIIFG